LPVNVSLLRSSIMIRAAPWGSARYKRCSWPIGARQEQWLRAHPQATATQAATLAPRPPFNARVETVTTKPFFREPFAPKGGLVVQSGARSLRHRDAIISLAARHKLPAVYSAQSASPFVFASERGGPFTPSGFAKLLARAGEEAKIGFKVHPHMLRHACGYALANKGIDTRTLQAYLGHRSINSTTRYAALAPGRFNNSWGSG
jgi:Phage integrase family